jgi:hypothetical protein
MKTKIMIAFLVITLAACAPAQTNTTDIQNKAVAIVQTGVALTQTGMPTPAPPTIPIITPDAIQLERWKEYQTELAKSILPYDPSPIVLCEWAILLTFIKIG